MTSTLACSLDPLPQDNSRRCKKLRRPSLRRDRDRHHLRRLLAHSTNSQHLLQIHARIIRSDLADPFLLNLMIRAHTAAGEPARALLLYNCMISSGVAPDKFTFTFALRACAACLDVVKGKEVHGFTIKAGFWRDSFLLNALIGLYFSCGNADDGRKVFEEMRVRSVVTWTAVVSGLLACGDLAAAWDVFDAMPERNVVSWTVVINGCARNGRSEEAVALFWRMLEEKQKPNSYTMVGLLVACSEIGSLSLVRWVHEFVLKNGMLERGYHVGTALIDVYSNCGSIGDALKVFEEMPVKSIATWNSIITSLGVHGRGEEAVELFREMREKKNVMPDGITFVGVLCACVRSGMIEEGLKFYKMMEEDYKIEPGAKHYECLVELLNSVSLQGKFSELSSEVNSQHHMLVNACTACGGNKAMGID